jgi:hypothetical protein
VRYAGDFSRIAHGGSGSLGLATTRRYLQGFGVRWVSAGCRAQRHGYNLAYRPLDHDVSESPLVYRVAA